MSVPEMEDRFNLNPRTLNPALRMLVHSGILNSRTGGRDRGYLLVRDPREISVYDIVQIIQGEPRVECCMESIGCTNCQASKQDNGRCSVYHKLHEVMNMTRSIIGDVSLYEQYYNKK